MYLYQVGGCVQVGSWETSKKLAAHLEQLGLKPAEHQHIAKALTKSVAKLVSPIADSMYPAGVSGPAVLHEEVWQPLVIDND